MAARVTILRRGLDKGCIVVVAVKEAHMYIIKSALNKDLTLCVDGKFHTRVMTGAGGYRVKVYKTWRNARRVRGGYETLIVCLTCNNDHKIMSATGNPKHPFRAVPCPDCVEGQAAANLARLEPRRVDLRKRGK